MPPIGGVRAGYLSAGKDAIPDSAGDHYYLGQPDNQHDIHYYKCSTKYDLTTRTSQNSIEDSNDQVHPSMTLKPDGSEFYYATGNGVEQYALSTNYEVDFDLSSETPKHHVTGLPDHDFGSINFNDDGTRFYITDTGSGAYVQQHNLSTAWDLSTATTSGNDGSKDLTTGGQTSDIVFNKDGSRAIWAGRSQNQINQADLSTAFDITTIETNNITSITAVDSSGSTVIDPAGVTFNKDGTKMWIRHWSPAEIHQYNLSTGWDITTASHDSLIFTAQSNGPTHLFAPQPWQFGQV